MRCAACDRELAPPQAAFTDDVCPHCRRLAHPTKLGGYVGLELLGRGGTAAVYKAQHPQLGTAVAIKVVRVPAPSGAIAERVDREARLAARIPHPGVVRIFEADHQVDRLYLVMEHVAGSTLRQRLAGGPIEIEWAIDKVAQLADVLQAAHGEGIVHRDVKPENVLVDAVGRVRVLDFGISRLLEDGERLTRTGEIVGTPEYLAPEQILDAPDAVDARTDVYACGVVLYELLTGTSPFAGHNLFQVLRLVESLTPRPPSSLRPGIPAELDRLVLAAIAKDKEARPASAAAFASALRALAPEAGAARRPARVAWIGALGVACAILGWVLSRVVAGGAAPASEPVSAVERIRALLTASARPAAGELPAAAMRIPDDAAAADLHWRGMARKHEGSLVAAQADLERAAQGGVADAVVQARVCWLYLHRLYPALLGGPMWLAAKTVAPARPDDSGLADLADNAWDRAAVRLASTRLVPSPDREVLEGLALALSGELERAALLAKRTLASAPDYVPLEMLAACLAGDPRRTEQTLYLARRIDRLDGMRYLLEMAAALHQGDHARLRAASELALVAGDGRHVTTAILACRVWCGSVDDPGRLLALAADLDARSAPVAVTRLLLGAAAGDAAVVDEALAALPREADAALEAFQGWQAVDPAERRIYEAWALWSMGRHAGATERASAWLAHAAKAVFDERGVARLFVAASLLPDDALAAARPTVDDDLARGLVGLVRQGSDLQRLERHLRALRLPAAHAARLQRAALAAARQSLASSLEPGRVVPLLRLAKRHGLDLAAIATSSEWAGLAEALRASHLIATQEADAK